MNKSPKQLVVLGDSGVFGWGDSEEGGWCERLRKNWMKLPNAPIVYPLGVRGDGLEKVASRWRNEWVCRGEMRRKLPEGIIISVGLNDTARIGKPNGRPQLSVDAYRYGYEQLLKEIKSQTFVMVLGLTPVDEVVMPFAECLWYSNDYGSIYESQIEESCLEADVPFLSLHKEMLNESNYLNFIEPDGIHLNSEGHSWIYNKLINWHSLLNWAELKQIKTQTYLI